MSPNLLIALIVLPLVGALIAWAGDVIGYRLGRNRQSLFGLRPRMTARVVAVAVGAALPLAGLGFAMAVSQDARDALLRIRQLREQAETLSVRNANLSAKIERAEKDARDARLEAEDATARRDEASAQLSSTRGALGASQAALSRTRASLQSARQGLQATRRNLSGTKKNLDAARASLKGAREALEDARRRLSTTQGDLSSVRADLDQTRRELDAVSTELGSVSKELMSSQAEVHKIQGLRREIALAEEHLVELDTQLAEARETVERYRREREAVMDQQVAYEPGAELVRGIVESRWAPEQLEAIIRELISYASQAAASHGIAPGPSGRSVEVVFPLPPGRAHTTEADIVQEVVSRISQADEPAYVVIVKAWDGAFDRQAEPMTVELWTAPNKVIFRPGETVFSTVIDGSLSRGHVFRGLWQTARQVRNIAADRGMLPIPQTGHYLEIPAEELLDALDEILKIGAPTRVNVVVETEARVAQRTDDPMLVRLDVAKVNGE